MNNLQRYAPWALAVLRIMVGLLFLEHGTQKLLGFPPGGSPMPALMTLNWSQGVIELVGGLLFTIGLFTPVVAFFLCGNMAVAYFMFHGSKNFYPMLNGGDAAVLYCFVFLYFIFSGAGPVSADAARGR